MNKKLILLVLILFVMTAFIACTTTADRTGVWKTDTNKPSNIAKGDELKIYQPKPEEAQDFLNKARELSASDAVAALDALASAVEANRALKDDPEVQALYSDLLRDAGACSSRREEVKQ